MSAPVETHAPAVTLAVLADPSADWDAFVSSQPGASIYLQSGWSLLAREAFNHQTYFIEARDASSRLVGVLPLVRQRGLLGDFLTSIPFFNYGGALAPSADVTLILMNRARDLAQSLGCKYLELRDVESRGGDWRVRTDKASMILSLPSSRDALSKQLGSKLRSQVKRADRESIAVRSGGEELLDAFYAVFAENMRDLGTPVYPKRFFRAILQRFPRETLLLVLDHQGKPGAAGFLVLSAGRAEIPWAACRNDLKPIGLNMKLYWEVLMTVMERGCTSFDFGRSTIDSGTYKFKKQWGAQPLQLHWHRWEATPEPAASEASGEEGRFRRWATAVWQRLPLPVANRLGPIISPGLPW